MKRTQLKRGKPLRRISKKKLAELPKLQAFRVEMLARAKGRCERCREKMHPYDLDIHHWLPRSQGGKDETDNVWVVCRRCHRLIHDHGDDGLSPWWKWIVVRNTLGKPT